MKTLNISISEADYQKFGFNTSQIKFTDFVEIVRENIIKSRLQKSLFLAKKLGLSAMSEEEINAEIQAVRNDKGNN